MAVETATILTDRACPHPADDPRVFAYLVEAAAEMFAVICDPSPGGEGEQDAGNAQASERA
jgi:hypothetical protein